MYYEEKIIDGVLCFRCSIDGEWTPFTAAELSAQLVEHKRTIGYFSFLLNTGGKPGDPWPVSEQGKG